MPYAIKKVGEDHVVVNSETGKQVPGGNHGSDEDKAKQHLAALYKNVKEAKSMAEYDTALAIKSSTVFSIGELEAALDVAITNEPINRREGNIEQADLELRHATDFRDAIDLLSTGKSLPSELTNSISSSIKSYLKGGPGSGRYQRGSGGVPEYRQNEYAHDKIMEQDGKALAKRADDLSEKANASGDNQDHALAGRAQLDAAFKIAGEKGVDPYQDEEAKKHSDLANAHFRQVSKPKKSFTDLKSAIEERVEELSVKGGSGSGNFGHQGRPGERGGSGEGGGAPKLGDSVRITSGEHKGKTGVISDSKLNSQGKVYHEIQIGKGTEWISEQHVAHEEADKHQAIASIKQTINQFYQGSGYDIWGDEVPSKSEYLDVVRDRTYDDLRNNTTWQGMSRKEQDKLILSVGP